MAWWGGHQGSGEHSLMDPIQLCPLTHPNDVIIVREFTQHYVYTIIVGDNMMSYDSNCAFCKTRLKAPSRVLLPTVDTAHLTNSQFISAIFFMNTVEYAVLFRC